MRAVIQNIISRIKPLLSKKITFSFSTDQFPISHRVISRTKNIAARIGSFARPRIIILRKKASAWASKFQKAPPQERFHMIKIPLLIFILALLLNRFGYMFLPPKIAVSFPADEAIETPLNSTIEIIFDRSVVRSSVEKNFRIEPKIEGTFSWESDQKVIFTPATSFTRASQYTITFDGFIFSTLYIPLLGRKEISFETLGNPKVVLASPQQEALESLSPITVIFDRQMIPLTTATNSGQRIPAFTVSPELPGEGRWLGTTAYQFRPKAPYKRATTYTVTVPAGMTSQDEGVLTNDFSWSFSSERPRVIDVFPEAKYEYASTTASIAATFNQPVVASSAKEHFKVVDEAGQAVDGNIIVQNHVVAFHPTRQLTREKKYTAIVAPGLLSAEGPNGLEEEYSWEFSITPRPHIIKTDPEHGNKEETEEHRLEVHFASPMDEESFKDVIHISPAPDKKPSIYFSSYADTHYLSVGTYLARSTKYTITIPASVKDQYGVAMGKEYSFSFETAAYKPSVSIQPSGTYFGSFNQAVVPRIVAKVVNTNSLEYSLYRLDRNQFLDLYKRRYTYDRCGSNPTCSNWQYVDTAAYESVHTWREQFEADFNSPVNVITKVTAADGSRLASGLYYLDIKLPETGAHDNMVMIVTKSTVTVKRSDNQIFAWVVNQATGDVVSDMNMELINDTGGILSSGKTNADGVFQNNEVNLFQEENLFMFGQSSDDIVVVSDSWDDGVGRYDFGLASHYNPQEQHEYAVQEEYKIYVTLDRPIYRPGHTVHFKGVIRKDNDGAFEQITQGEKIAVTISDTRNRSVYTSDLPITSFGSFSGELLLSADGDLGNYEITATYKGSSYYQRFQVEEYKKQDLSVTVTPNKSSYITGQEADITVGAAYYFGAPVTDTPTSWILQTYDYSFSWDKDTRFEFGDPEDYWSWWFYEGGYSSGKKVTEGTAKTNTKGEVNISIPLNINEFKKSQRMTVEATVNDNNNQAIAASETFIVHKGGIYAGLHPERYSNKTGTEARVEVVTVDTSGKETPQTPVSVVFYKREWEEVREKDPDTGEFYYTSKPKDEEVSKSEITTDSLGYAVASFTPSEGGTYKVSATVADAEGKTNTSGSYLWVSGHGFSAARENHDRILLITDKRSYTVGEEASLFVATPYAEEAKTLLTVERGSVLDYKVVSTSETSNNFPFSILPTHTPNIFFSAVLVRPGAEVKKPAEFKIGYAEVAVDDKKQHIDVSIKTDKKRYKPNETLSLTVETKDLLGHPVAAEVALGVVDKSVWDLSTAEISDIYETFYLPKNLGVSTSHLLTRSIDRINANTSLGSKGGSGGGGGDAGFETSRRNFPDTAFWNAHVVTDANGKATLEIPLPDSLTTWRIGATANTNESAFGSQVSEIIVSKDVLLRPFMPRFLSVGDQPELGAIAVNTSGQTQTFTAQIVASGMDVVENKTQTYTLADGQHREITWKSTVASGEKAVITVSIHDQNNKPLDSVEVSLPVKSYSIPETVATSGQAKDSAEEMVLLPEDVDKTQGNLNVSLSPSLGSGSIEALPYVLDYPYYCAEQITSRFMPAVFVHRLFTKANIDKSGSIDAKRLKDIISDGIQRLNTQQKPDGGWGWWMEYDSDPFLTAYALFSLEEAKKDGFAVSQETVDRAKRFLTYELSKGEKSGSLNTQAYILYVLKNNLSVASYASTLYTRRFELSVEARAYLAIAMKSFGMNREANKLYTEFVSLAKKTNTTTHWEDTKRDYRFMGSNTTATAAGLDVLLTFNKNNPLIPEVIRYLMSTRYDGHWSTTRDTAAVIHQIASQVLVKGDEQADFAYKLEVNGKTVKEGSFTKEDLLNLESYVVSVSDLEIGKKNPVRITKSGAGNLYYNMNLKYYLPFSEITPLEQGMVVLREFVDAKGSILPIDKINENTEIWVRLIVVAPEERHYVVLEDILPAGLESVNESLKNVSSLSKYAPRSNDKSSEFYYFRHLEYHDDRTTLFTNYLPAGIYEFAYRVRATTPGKYHHPPAQAYQMYLPDISGHSAGGWLEVVKK